jgi:hypothetical protein
MTERVSCPQCRHENPPENRFCGGCGVALRAGSELMPRLKRSRIAASRAWPAKLTPAGRTLAIGLVVLVAGVGSSLLRPRARRDDRSPSSAARVTAPSTPEFLIGESVEEVLVWLQGGDLSGSMLRATGGRYIRRLKVDR